MPTLNIPPTFRFVLYLVSAVGSIVAAYLFAKGYVGEPETAAWAGLVAIINGIAAANTSITGATVVAEGEEGAANWPMLTFFATLTLVAIVLFGWHAELNL